MGDDVRPPWNHASSILVKRLIECLSPEVDCSLATVAVSGAYGGELPDVQKVFVSGFGRTTNSVRLAMAVQEISPDIAHLVGTNALVFSPLCKLLRSRIRIVRHVFTSYDSTDRMIRPGRWVVNRLFIDGYAFTTAWIGEWAKGLGSNPRRFLFRPPIDCELYRRRPSSNSSYVRAETGTITMLYMGPLFRSRFPGRAVLGGLRLLIRNGVGVRLVVLTSASRVSNGGADGLVRMARELGVESNFLVRRVDLSEPERVAAYNAADIVLFPFVGPVPEKLADPPFGAIEAMACGRTVLGTKVLSLPELVEHGEDGLLVGRATAEGISDCVGTAIRQGDLESIGSRARRKVLGLFSYPVVRRRIVDSYRSLLEKD